MPISVYQLTGRNERVDIRDPQATLRAVALRSNDEAAVRAAVIAFFNGLYPDGYYGLSLASASLTELGGGVWQADVDYHLETGDPIPGGLPGTAGGPPGPSGNPPPTPAENAGLNENFSFKTGGGTQHITQSLKTRLVAVRAGMSADSAPNFKGAIGVNGDRLEGCDIITPKLEWSYTVTVPKVSFSYIGTLRDMVGTTNAGRFFYHDEGECLFMGASGQLKGPEGWSVTYDFGMSPNLTNITIIPPVDPSQNQQPELVVSEKRGWEYLWVYYEPSNDTRAGKLTRIPLCAYVEQVYRAADFNALGIGGA